MAQHIAPSQLVVLGLFVFHEKASPNQLIGMMLGLAAIVFLSL